MASINRSTDDIEYALLDGPATSNDCNGHTDRSTEHRGRLLNASVSNVGSLRGTSRNHASESTRAAANWWRGTKKAIAASKMQDAIEAVRALRASGAAPGIDLRRQRYDELANLWNGPCQAMVVDYGCAHACVVRGLHDAKGLQAALAAPRPEGAPVRWVHLDGLNWHMVSALGSTYELHPLALEDTMHVPQRIKADWYDGCLYLSLVHMYLGGGGAPHLQRGTSSISDPTGCGSSGIARQQGGMEHDECIVKLATEQVSLFLLRGGVVVSIFQRDGCRVSAPILQQVEEPRTLVRDSEDASLLCHLLLDAVVDHCYPVVDAFAERLQTHEGQVLSGAAQASSTRQLHRMQRDLLRIMRMLAPLQGLVASLVMRTEREAANGHNGISSHSSSLMTATHSSGSLQGGSTPLVPAPAPLISALTVTYLGDVRDHTYTLAETMASLAAECKDLVDLIFNLTAHAQSQSTQALAVVSVIFLPISFLAGVYGTNFEFIPGLHWARGFYSFWALCGAVTVIFLAALWRMGLFSSR